MKFKSMREEHHRMMPWQRMTAKISLQCVMRSGQAQWSCKVLNWNVISECHHGFCYVLSWWYVERWCLKLAHAVLGPHSTDCDHAQVTEGLNRLRQCMDTWFEVQQVYMPGVAVWQSKWNKAQLLARSEAEALVVAQADADAAETGGGDDRRSCNEANTVQRCPWRKLLMLSQCCSFSLALVWNTITRTKSLWILNSVCGRLRLMNAWQQCADCWFTGHICTSSRTSMLPDKWWAHKQDQPSLMSLVTLMEPPQDIRHFTTIW